jgi:hypothetical protein
MKRTHRLSRHFIAIAALTGLTMSAEGAELAENTAGAPTGTAEQAAPVEKTPGVGDKAKELIRAGLGNKEVLEGVQAAFPAAKTTMASINWYRNHLRGLGEDVKTARELAAVGKPTKEQVAAEKAEKKAAEKAAKEEAKAAAKAEKAAKKEADKKAAAEAKAAAAAAAKGGEQAPADATAPAADAGASTEGQSFLE